MLETGAYSLAAGRSTPDTVFDVSHVPVDTSNNMEWPSSLLDAAIERHSTKHGVGSALIKQ
jgi:hypothetical protein